MAKVALAEDNKTMQHLLGTLLRMDGYDVTTVDGDQDLIAILEDTRPDALILDMRFAEHSGLELVARVRRSELGKRLYVLMMSGLSVSEDCLRHGADDFLLKPFMPEELTGLLRARLQSAA